jgi:hypothetical protein
MRFAYNMSSSLIVIGMLIPSPRGLRAYAFPPRIRARARTTARSRASESEKIANAHQGDAQRFLAELRERFAKFGLELHPDKTRLIEFGRYAAERRRRRGLPKPETFDFLGFTHICARMRDGRFWVRRITISKRMRAKLRGVKDQLRRRRHQPIPEQAQWLASVMRGHRAYYAVPGNRAAVATFRTQVTKLWHEALERRSQRTRINWARMNRLAIRWLPPARVVHPFPDTRFRVRTQGRSPVR